MAVAKKKPRPRRKIQASDVVVNNRELDNILRDLAEQIKANEARSAERALRSDERSAQLEERSAQLEERSAQNEELIRIALQTISSVSLDLRAMTQELRTMGQRTDDRLSALEKAVAAE